MQVHPFVILALASVPFLFNTGLQVSGYSNATITAICWTIAGIIVILAGIEYARKWNAARRSRGLVGLESWYFIVACLAIAGLAIASAAYAVGLRSNSAIEVRKTELQSSQTSSRLIKDPRIEWENTGRVSLKGRYTRHGGPASVYVTYWMGNGYPVLGRPNPVLSAGQPSTEPRIKVDSISYFDREEGVDLTIGFILEDNGKTLQWGLPQQNKTKIGITFGHFFGAIVLVWNEGKDEESYPFILTSRALNPNEPGASQPSPLLIGPDALFAQRGIESK